MVYLACLYSDDKKLSGVLKKMALTDLKGVEEVNIFKADGSVIHITAPKSKFYLVWFVVMYTFMSYISSDQFNITRLYSPGLHSFQHLCCVW